MINNNIFSFNVIKVNCRIFCKAEMHENFNVEINSPKQSYTYTFGGRSENTNKRTKQLHFS